MKRGLAGFFGKRVVRNAAIVLAIALVAYFLMKGVHEGFQASSKLKYLYFNTSKHNTVPLTLSDRDLRGKKIKDIRIEKFNGSTYEHVPIDFNQLGVKVGLETKYPGKATEQVVSLNDIQTKGISNLFIKRLDVANLGITTPYEDTTNVIDTVMIKNQPNTELSQLRESGCLQNVNTETCKGCIGFATEIDLTTAPLRQNDRPLVVQSFSSLAKPTQKTICMNECTKKLLTCSKTRYANGRVIIEFV